MADAQLEVAVALRERLPRVNAVFLTGAITYRMVTAIVNRTRLVGDPPVLAQVDEQIASHLGEWTALSLQRLHAAIDYWVDRYDPAAVRRAQTSSRERCITIHNPQDGSGLASIEGYLYAQDGGRTGSEEHTLELQTLMAHRIAVFCLKKKQQNTNI